MTIDEQIKILESNSEFERKEGDLQGCLNFKQLAEWLKDYKRLKEQEPCGDCISREAVMHILDEVGGDFDSPREAVVPIDYIADMVADLPSVSPQQKAGRWKRISMDKYSEHAKYWYRCDRCGKDNLGSTDYCPNCGAKMQEVEK